MSKLTALALRDFTQTPDNPACELCHSMTNVRRRVAAASVCMVCGAHMCVAHMHRYPNYASVILSSMEARTGSRLATPCSSLCKLCGMYMGCNQFWRIKPTQYRYRLISAYVSSRIFNEWRIPCLNRKTEVPDHTPEDAAALVPENTVKLAVDSDAEDTASGDTSSSVFSIAASGDTNGAPVMPNDTRAAESDAGPPRDECSAQETNVGLGLPGARVSGCAPGGAESVPEMTAGQDAVAEIPNVAPAAPATEQVIEVFSKASGRTARKKNKRKKCNVPACAPMASGRAETVLPEQGEKFHAVQQRPPRHAGYRRGGPRRPWIRSSSHADTS